MNFHPLSELFPLMQGREFGELVADVKANGLREAIWTYDGQILDGRNRWRACEAAGIASRPMREYTGDDALSFVISLNLKRRQLSASELAFVALAIEAYEAELAKKRQAAKGEVLALMPEVEKGNARDKAAAAVGISPRYVQDAKKIESEAPELAAEVRAGVHLLPYVNDNRKPLIKLHGLVMTGPLAIRAAALEYLRGTEMGTVPDAVVKNGQWKCARCQNMVSAWAKRCESCGADRPAL